MTVLALSDAYPFAHPSSSLRTQLPKSFRMRIINQSSRFTFLFFFKVQFPNHEMHRISMCTCGVLKNASICVPQTPMNIEKVPSGSLPVGTSTVPLDGRATVIYSLTSWGPFGAVLDTAAEHVCVRPRCEHRCSFLLGK